MTRFWSRSAALGAWLGWGGSLFFAAAPARAAQEVKAQSAGSAAGQGRAPDYDGPPLLVGNGRKVKVGAYGGLGGAYTRLMGDDSGLVTFEGALLFDHRLSLGLAGY